MTMEDIERSQPVSASTTFVWRLIRGRRCGRCGEGYEKDSVVIMASEVEGPT